MIRTDVFGQQNALPAWMEVCEFAEVVDFGIDDHPKVALLISLQAIGSRVDGKSRSGMIVSNAGNTFWARDTPWRPRPR